MSIADFFFGRKQNKTNSRRNAKLNRNAVRTRTLSMEPLETRDLLSVTTGLNDDSAYAALREQYPDFNLPADKSELNVMIVDCNLADLKSAITQAGESTKPDLILVKTTDDANTITYTTSSNEITLNIDSEAKGSVTIIGWGTKELTLDANKKCRVMSISGNTVTNMGNAIITNGSVTSYGGGIYSTSSGSLTLNNCTITSNKVSSSTNTYGGGIYISNSSNRSTGALTLTNCTISNNTTSASSSSYTTHSYGGGICVYNTGNRSIGDLTLTNCVISGNTASSSCSAAASSYDAYSYGGGICIFHSSTGSIGSLTLTNSTISNNTASSSNLYTTYSYGGGICINNLNTVATGAISIIDSNIIDNTVTSKGNKFGAGVYMNGSVPKLTIVDSSIASISDTDLTRSVFQTSGDLLIKNSSLTYASISVSGGNTWSILNSSIVGTSSYNGIEITSGDLSSNLTVSNSIVRNCQYGIRITTPINANIVNSTITNNSKYGLYLENSSPILNIYNSIIVKNTSNKDVYKGSGSINAYNTLSSFTDWTNKSNATNYPFYSAQNLFDDEYKLATNSQALNKGNPAYLLDYTDLAGNDRIQGMALDLGAYEYEETPSIVFSKETPSVVVNTLDDIVDEYDDMISLREALMLYAGMDDLGTVITFDKSVCDGQTIALSGMPLFIRKSITLDASNLDNKLTIDAGGLTRAIQIFDDEEKFDVSFINIDITGGNSLYGAAIFNRNSDLTLDSCNIQYNTGYSVYNGSGDLTISASELSNNSASSNMGGGLYNVSGNVVIDNAKMINNAYSGVYNNSGTLTISNSQINNTHLVNNASYGIYNASGHFSLSDSEINNNAQYGIYSNSSSDANAIVNCNISNNSGTGFFINTGTTNIDNSTINMNAVGIGMGTSSNVTISNSLAGGNSQYGVSTKGTIDAYNCTIAGSGTADISCDAGVVMMYNTIAPAIATSNSGIVSGSYNLSSFDSWSTGSGNAVYDSESPLFVDAENSDFRLAENSQAIDKGNNRFAVDAAGNALTVDLADVPRIQGTKIDIGAYEFDIRNLLVSPEFTLTTDNSSVIVTISEVENATGYQIEYALNEDFTDSAVTDALAGENVLDNLAQGQTYYVRVMSVGDDVYTDSDYSETQSILLELVPPAPPTIAVEVNSIDSVTATVSETDNAVGYRIQYSVDEDFTRSTIVAIDAGETILRGLNPGTTYYFRAYAYSDAGLSSDFSNVETVTLPDVPVLTELDTPDVPSLTLDGTTVTATWSAVENASTYTVEYLAIGSDAWTTIPNIAGTTTSFVGLIGTTYNVKVKANGTGDYSDSTFSESASVYIPISLSGLTLSTDTPEVGTTITTTLAPSDATVDYQWYCGTTIIDGADESSFTVTEEQIGQTITCVATGTGNFTGTVSATTAVVPALPLDTPNAPTLTLDGTTVTATWSAHENASTYTLQYQADGVDGWFVITGINGTTASFAGIAGKTYNVKVKAVGTGNYSESEFSESTPVYIPIPLSGLTLSNDAPEVGTTITTILAPSDAAVDYQWYCGTTIIDGAEESSFTVTEEQIGQTITCIATGTGYYTGTVSATTAVVPAFELESPVLSSLNTVGSIVVAAWSDVDDADGYTLEYKPEASQKWTSISGLGNTTAAFVGVAGTTYNVRVKANGTGTYSDSSYSATESITLSVPLTGLTLSTTTPEVGTVITTTLAPSDATADYQWYSGETIIDGATESSFTVTEEQIGQTITCVATGADGYIGTVSATTSVVPALALDVPGVPELTLDGTTVNAAWSTVDNASGYTLEYQPAGAESWSVITGISGESASFNGVAGATYNVRVKANGTGYYSDSEYSESASVYIPIPLTGLTLSTENPIVGTIITTSLTPSDATVEYQWYSNETIIEGATTSSFTVTEDYIGQTITCVATANGAYTGSVSAITAEVPVPIIVLDAPADFALSVYNATVSASWSAVDNASSYTLEYKPADSENWTALPGLQDTTASFDGVPGTMYNVRVKANGTDGYSDSSYSEVNTDKPTGPVVAINLNKVTVSWVDDSPAADSVRYRVAGTAKWTVKKLKAGVTSLTFSASIGVNYEIEVLLDQQETNVLQGSAIVLDQPKLKADKTFLKDDTFQVEVTNYAAKNLAANVKQAIVSVNGVMTTLNISNQKGECNLVNGGKVAFNNGRFTFSEMTSNTSYKVQISFSDGHSVSKTSSALTVKTTKTCYLAPVITSAAAVSDTSITVTWQTAKGKNSDTEAQKYTVQYSLDGVKWTNATTAATGNSYTIQKLKGGNVYQVRVLATKDSAFEASVPSAVLTAETLTAPKAALNSTSVKDDTFQLNVTNYQTTNLPKATVVNVKSDQFGETVIHLENGAGSAAFDNGMTVAFNNGALTFANAPSNTQQKIQVNFSDGVCTTAWSAALTVKTAIASYNQPVLTSATAVDSTSVLVEWSPAVGKNSNIPAQSYTVQYTTDGERWINANTKVVETSYTITGLTSGTNYLVAVIANKDSRFNASQPSESLPVRTL